MPFYYLLNKNQFLLLFTKQKQIVWIQRTNMYKSVFKRRNADVFHETNGQVHVSSLVYKDKEEKVPKLKYHICVYVCVYWEEVGMNLIIKKWISSFATQNTWFFLLPNTFSCLYEKSNTIADARQTGLFKVVRPINVKFSSSRSISMLHRWGMRYNLTTD